MHKTVLIILAAVVALIVIVVLTGMRYLRADDEDEYGDEIGAERGQSRGRGEHPARDHGRSRRHDDDRRGDEHRQRSRGDRDGAGHRSGRDGHAILAAAGAARRGSGRDDSSGRGAGRAAMSRAGTGRDGASRDGASRDAGIRSGDRRGPGRDGAVRDGALRDMPGRDGAARRGGERGWGDSGRDDRRNSGPQRRVTGSRDYERDSSDELITASNTSSRGSAGRGGMRADDLDEPTARASGRDDRERRGNSVQNARPDRRTSTSQSRKDDSLPDIKPRPGKTSPSKSKRDDDGDWPSTEWDELSDVDYWAELASDKPFNSAAQSPAPSSRPDRDRADARPNTDSGPVRAVDRRDSSGRRDSADRRESLDRRDSTERREQLLPAARATRQTVDAAFTPPVAGDPVDQAFGGRTDAYGSTELRRAIASGRASTSGPHRIPQPADDDPLTSPSFPRVSADDSRSYRRSGGRGQGESQSQTRPHPTYPPVPSHPPVGPLDSQPGLSRTPGFEYAAAPPDASSYSTPAPAAPAASYLPPAGNGYPPDSVSSAYPTPTSATSGYSAVPPGSYQGADSANYQAPLPAPFPAEHDSGYGSVAPAGGAGYSAAPAAASYPIQPAEPLGYPSYPGNGQSHAALPQSTGFSYSQPGDPGFAGQLPAAQPSGSYVGYQPPVNTGQAGVYQAPGMLPPQSVQPGYPSAPYSAGSYEPPGYPAPTHAYEADNGYPADPYAVDPYGYPGYGSARLSDQRWRGQSLSDQRWDERSRQVQSWDDRSGTAEYGYQQYWEDDDR